MLPTSRVPLPEPPALLDATLLFLIQVLLARHPDLLAAYDDNDDAHSPAYPLGAARHILLAVREVHCALDRYRALFPDEPGFRKGAGVNDEIPLRDTTTTGTPGGWSRTILPRQSSPPDATTTTWSLHPENPSDSRSALTILEQQDVSGATRSRSRGPIRQRERERAERRAALFEDHAR